MLKRPRGDERVVPSSVDDDVACSRESVNRARRVLHRELLELRRRQSDCDDADPEEKTPCPGACLVVSDDEDGKLRGCAREGAGSREI